MQENEGRRPKMTQRDFDRQPKKRVFRTEKQEREELAKLLRKAQTGSGLSMEEFDLYEQLSKKYDAHF